MLTDPEILKYTSDEHFIELLNPKLKSYSAVRNSLLPTIILSILSNAEKYDTLSIFEIGDVVSIVNGKALSDRRLSFGIYGDKITLTNALIIVKSLMDALNIPYRVEEVRKKAFIEGRTARVIVDGESIGYVGEVHPEILEKLSIRKPIVVGELSITKILKWAQQHKYE